MHTVSNNLEFIMYADDTTLISPMLNLTPHHGNSVRVISMRINHELRKITDWLAVNKLSLNASKTKYMIFHYQQRKIEKSEIPKLNINGTQIELVDDFNFLGLTIDKNITWCSHINKIANKIARIIGIMNRLKRSLPYNALKLMYDSLIGSHLQFCITAWGYKTTRLENLQKRALRVVHSAKYNAHTEPLLKASKLLMVRDIFNLNCLKIYHKYNNHMLPNFFKNIFARNSEVHSYNTRNKDNPHYFRFQKKGSRKRIRHSVPNLINDLPGDVKLKLESLDLKQFTTFYKLYVIDSYSYVCRLRICRTCGRE